MPTLSTPETELLVEARAIARGESRQLATRAHVIAMQAELDRVAQVAHQHANEIMRLRFVRQVMESNPTLSVREACARAGCPLEAASSSAGDGAGVAA